MEWEAGLVTVTVFKVWGRDKFIVPAGIRIPYRPAQKSVGSASNMDTIV
jgi:hypothetical protein